MLRKCKICYNTICPVCYYCHRCDDAKRGEDINFFSETFILDKKTAFLLSCLQIRLAETVERLLL